MNIVKVHKAELLTKLEANRNAHRDLFIAAQEGYRKTAIQKLDEALKDAREGREVRTMIHLQAPQDHTEEYDNAIEMLRMSVDDVIELEAHDFQCYVMNKWQWFAQVNLLNSTYAAAR